jgi:DNA-binding IclR family transcriptional regulator
MSLQEKPLSAATPHEPLARPRAGVPAVLHALAILRHLQSTGNKGATMTEIANGLSINQSTCFNILKTLAADRFLSYDEDTRRYTLGMALIELGALVDHHGRLLSVAQTYLDVLAEEVEQACLAFRKTPDDAFLVVSKAEGRRQLRLTAGLGDRFPPNAAVLAKSWYAWEPDSVVDRMIELHGLPAHAPSAITGILDFKSELARTRARGYAVSIGEYYPEHNAVGCPVLAPDGSCQLLLVITGFASVMTAEAITVMGPRLAGIARDISTTVFGASDR